MSFLSTSQATSRGVRVPLARSSDPETSHAAASSMRTAAAVHREQIVAALRAQGGMTSNELDRFFGWRDATAGRRMSELVEDGAVVASGEQRPTESGRMATVYYARIV